MWTMIASFLVLLLVLLPLSLLIGGALGPVGTFLLAVMMAIGVAAGVYTANVRLKRVEEKLDQLLARESPPAPEETEEEIKEKGGD